MTATALFVLGFTVVFLAQSVAVIGFSRAMLVNSETLMRVGGAVTIVMGVAMLGLIRPLQAERRLHAAARPAGSWAPRCWARCSRSAGPSASGPTLVGVLSLANATDWGGSAWRGLSLVIFYCAGLGIPFLLLAFGFGWATGALGFLRRHTRTIQIVGAVCLIVLGRADGDRALGNVHRLAAGPVRRDRDACCDGPRQQPDQPAGWPSGDGDRRAPAGGRRVRGAAAAERPAGALAFGRNVWRQLTSMRTALILLFLLALASLPGALLPQWSLNTAKTAQYIIDHPTLGPLLDRFGFFEVFGSPWYAAIYLLLFTLADRLPAPADHRSSSGSCGCRPVATPRNLGRLPHHHRERCPDRRTRWPTGSRPACAAGGSPGVDRGSGPEAGQKPQARKRTRLR